MDSSDFVILAVSIDEDINEAEKVFSGKLQVKSLDFYRESAELLGQDFPVERDPHLYYHRSRRPCDGLAA